MVSYDINYGPKELIKDKQTGNLVPAGDAWTLQRTLLTHRDLLKQYSQRAAETMLPYSQTKVTQKWIDFINQIPN